MTADKTNKNELDPRLMAIASTNPYDQHDSSSRKQMYHTHLGQSLVTSGMTRRRIQSGIEREYGEYTFDIRMPCNAQIIRIVQLYSPKHSLGQIKDNPETLIIFRNYDTEEFDCLTLTKNHVIDKDFGFDYVYTDKGLDIGSGKYIKKDTVLARSPAKTEDGDYMFGRQTPVAFMSVPAVIEDGVVASEAYCERNKIKAYGKRTIIFGHSGYPLNLYGHTSDTGQYRPFPNIGDHIRDDGLLFARRNYDEYLAPVEMTPEALKQPDYIYDHLIYAIPNAKVVDVRVNKSVKNHPRTPVGMEEQSEMYVDQSSAYLQEINSAYKSIVKQTPRGKRPKISPRLQQYLVQCLQDPNINPDAGNVTLRHKTNKLDEWHITITFEYELTPTIGFKLTDSHGGKGVICEVWPEEDMPVDQWGNRAELIMDGLSTVKRMNPGRLYEHYHCAAAETFAAKLRHAFGYPKTGLTNQTIPREEAISAAMDSGEEMIEKWYANFKDFVSNITPSMHAAMEELEADKGFDFMAETVVQIIHDGVYLWIPTNNPMPSADTVRNLRKNYPPNIGPVQYRGSSGNIVTTKKDVLIASMYVMMLNKVGSAWQAVASSKLQHYGILAKLTNADKYGSPGRQSPVRIYGESEVRLMSATLGADVMADIMDQSGNPRTHKAVVENILRAPEPTNIDRVINRKKHPLGHSRPLLFTRHLLECGGVEFYDTGVE